MKHDVQFAHVSKVPVQYFHEPLNLFQDDQDVVVRVDREDEVERRVSFVHQLVRFVIDDVAQARRTWDDEIHDVALKLETRSLGIRLVVLRETNLTLLGEEKGEVDHDAALTPALSFSFSRRERDGRQSPGTF